MPNRKCGWPVGVPRDSVCRRTLVHSKISRFASDRLEIMPSSDVQVVTESNLSGGIARMSSIVTLLGYRRWRVPRVRARSWWIGPFFWPQGGWLTYSLLWDMWGCSPIERDLQIAGKLSARIVAVILFVTPLLSHTPRSLPIEMRKLQVIAPRPACMT